MPERTYPILHVVYAGYGDSLYLEFTHKNKRRLIVIDGGPKVRGATSHQYAPYSEYFITAGQAIWSQMRQRALELGDPIEDPGEIFSPLAIINSHPDHDHYQGLIELLKNELSAQWSQAAQPGSRMFFNGPYLLPRPRELDGTFYKPKKGTVKDIVHKTLVNERKFNEGCWKLNPVDLTLPDLSALDIRYPTIKTRNSFNIWAWNRTEVQQPDPLDADVPEPEDDIEPPAELEEEVPEPNDFTVMLGNQAGVNHNLPALRIKRPINVQADRSVTNISSMLVMMKDETEGQVVLTGDGAGTRIKKHCFGDTRPHVNIFKIQHHGSINNSLVLDDVKPYKWTLAVEVALRELMELGWGEELSGIDHYQRAQIDQYYTVAEFGEDDTLWLVRHACFKLTETVSYMITNKYSGTEAFLKDAVHNVNDPFAVALNAKFPPETDPGDEKIRQHKMVMLAYLNRLRVRHAEYLKCFEIQWRTGWSMWDLEKDADIVDMELFEPSNVHGTMREALENAAKANISPSLLPVKDTANLWDVDEFYNYQINKEKQAVVVCKQWWAKWGSAAHGSIMNTWLGLYTTLRSVGLAMNFYSTFTADAYVVSANGTHGHPSPAVILAIALVAAKDHIESKKVNGPDVHRTLYATLGHAVPAAWIQHLASYVCPMELVAQAIGGNGCLSIRYLSKGFYMSLDGSKTITGTRDILDMTEQWIPGQANNTEDVYEILEQDHTVLPIRPKQRVKYIFHGGKPTEDPLWILDNPPANQLVHKDPTPSTVYTVSQVLDSFQGMNYLILEGHNQDVWHAEYRRVRTGGFKLFFLQEQGDTFQYYTWYYEPGDGNYEFLSRQYVDDLNTQHGKSWKPIVFQAFKAKEVHEQTQPVINHQQHFSSMQSTHLDDDLVHQTAFAYEVDETTSLRNGIEDLTLAEVSENTQIAHRVSALPESKDTDGVDTDSVDQIEAHTTDLVQHGQEVTVFSRVIPTLVTSKDADSSSALVAKRETKKITEYFKDAQLNIDTTGDISARRSLEAVIGVENVVKLNLSRSLEKSTMNYNIDKSLSTVVYDVSGLNVIVYGALLQLQLPANAKVTVEGDPLAVKSSVLDIEWNTGKPMIFKTKVEMDDGNASLTLTRGIKPENATRGTSLAKILSYLCAEAGIPANFESIAFPRAFSLLSRRTPQTATTLLVKRLPKWLVDVGLLKATIDVNRSTVVAWPTPNGGLDVEQADLVCNISKLLQEANELPPIVELKISFGDVKLTLKEPGSTKEKITLEGSVTIEKVTLSFSVAMMEPDAAVAQDAVQWTFKASSTTSVSDLSELWPKNKDSLKEVKQAPFSSSQSPLTGIEHSAVGFIVSQPMARVSKYMLASIFVVTSLDDWRKFLPSNLPKDDFKATGRLEVRHPFDSKLRTIGASVDFAVEVTTKYGLRELKAALVAEPIGLAGTYDYRLFIGGSEEGVTVIDIAKRLGWEDKIRDLSTSLPTIYEALESLRLRNLAVAVRSSGGKWSFTDFILELSISKLALLGNFAVENTDIDLEYSSNQWTGKVSGELQIAKKTAKVVLTLPQPGQKGFLDVESPQGVNMSDVLTAFSLPSITDVPVLDDILSIELKSAILTLERSEEKTTVTGTSFQLELSKLKLDIMEITNVHVKIATDKFKSKEKKEVSMTAFSVQGVIRGSYAISVAFNSFTRLLTAGFQAGQPTSIAETIKMVLGEGVVSGVLDAVVGHLGVAEMFIEFDGKTKKPRLFNILLVDTATVQVQDVVLENLRLEYIAARPAVGETPASPAIFNLMGNSKAKPDGPKLSAIFGIKFAYDAAKQTKSVEMFVQELSEGSLKLSGALSLFGWKEPPNARPEGLEDPNSFDLAVRRIAGEVSITKTTKDNKTTSTIVLESLDIIVEKDKPMPITMFPDLKLDKFALFIQYRKVADPSLQGHVWAQITLYEDILATLKYSVIKGEKTYQEFYGKITKKVTDENQPVVQKSADFRKLAVKYLGQDTTPDGLDVPFEIPMPELEVRYQPKQKFEILGDSGPQKWVISTFGDLKPTVTNLAGRLIVLMPKDGNGEKQFDATLYGALAFNAFTSLEAIVHIKDKKKPILRALIKKQDSKNNEIAELTKSASGKQDAWTELLPTDTKALSFSQAEMRLVLDLSTSTFVLAGFIQGIGFAVLIIKKDTEGKYSYLVNIMLTNIYDIWPDLKPILGDWMTFESITLQFSSKAYLLSALKSDLELLKIQSDLESIAEPKSSDPKPTEPATQSEKEKTDAKSLEEQSKALDKTTEHIPKDGLIPQGICIHAVLAFEKTGPINESLQSSTAMTTPPRVYLDAEVPQAKSTGGTYSITMTDFELLGGAIILKKGKGTYKGAEKKLVIGVELQLKLEGNADPFKFDASFKAEATQTSFEVSLKKDPSPNTNGTAPATNGTLVQNQQGSVMKNPFGGMFTLEIEVTKFTGTITKPPKPADSTPESKGTPKYELVGTMKIAKLSLDASLLFVGGSPKLSTLSVTPELLITQVYTDIINRDSSIDPNTKAEWPENDFDVIKLKKALIYYSSDSKALTIPDDKNSYEPGFNILAEIELFQVDFIITAHLPKGREGVSISGSPADKVNFGFGKLTRKSVREGDKITTPAGGPVVSIKSLRDNKGKTENQYGVSSGVQLLDIEGFAVDLTYKKSTGFTGEASYTGTISVLNIKDPKVSVTYKDKKFTINGLGTKTDMKLKIAKAMRDAAKDHRKSCPEIVKLLFDKATKTKFDYTLNFTGVHDKAADIEIKGNFTVALDVPATNITVKEVTFEIPFIAAVPLEKPTADSLLALLADTIVKNLKAIGTAILDEPAKASIIVGWMSVKDFAADLIAGLICRDIDPPNVHGRAWDLRPDNHPDDKKKPSNWWKWFLGALAVIGTAVALYFAVNALIALAAEYGAYYLAMEGRKLMLEKMVAFLSAQAAKGIPAPGLANFQAALAGITTVLAGAATKLAEAKLDVRKSLNLKDKPTVNLSSKGNALKVDWSKVVPQKEGSDFITEATAGFVWEVYTSLTNQAPSNSTASPEEDVHETTGTSIQIHKEAFSTAPYIFTWVRAKYSHPKMTVVSESWTACNIIQQTPRLAPVESVQLSVDDVGLECLLTVPGGLADKLFEYQLFLTPEGKTVTNIDSLGTPQVVTGSEASLQIPIVDIDWYRLIHSGAKRQLQASLRLKSAAPTKTDSAITWSNRLPLLPAPIDVAIVYQAGKLNGTWVVVNGAKDFEILFKNKGQVIARKDAALPLQMPVAGEPFEGKGDVQLYVRQKPGAKEQIVGLFSRCDVQIFDVAVPVISQKSFYDIPSQEFRLFFSLSNALAAADLASFLVYPFTTTNSVEVVDTRFDAISVSEFENSYYVGNDKGMILVRIPKGRLPNDLPVAVAASAVDNDGMQGPLSKTWKLPLPLPETLALSSFAPSFDASKKSLTIKWSKLEGAVTRLQIMVAEAEGTTSHGGRRNKEVPAGDLTAVFEDSEDEFSFVEGQTLNIVVFPWKDGAVRGAASKFDFAIPITSTLPGDDDQALLSEVVNA